MIDKLKTVTNIVAPTAKRPSVWIMVLIAAAYFIDPNIGANLLAFL